MVILSCSTLFYRLEVFYFVVAVSINVLDFSFFLKPVIVSSSLQLGKEKFHKSQHWSYCNKVSMLVGEDKPGIGGEPLLGQKLKPKYSVFPRGVGSDAPSWVAFDKQVG